MVATFSYLNDTSTLLAHKNDFLIAIYKLYYVAINHCSKWS